VKQSVSVAGAVACAAVLVVGVGLADEQRRQVADALAEPFVGVTTDGEVERGLYEISSTGVSTAPMVAAAEAFLATLDEDQRDRTTFPVDSIEWRDWHNVHRYERKGIARWEMSETQEARLKRLKMRSMRRGIKEMDLILGGYADGELAALSDGDLALYDALLAENDHDLYAWVSGQAPTPQRFLGLVTRIAAHQRETASR